MHLTTRTAPPAAHAERSPAFEYYVLLTRRAMFELRGNLLAIGIYALIARVYRATRQPVPLSAADVSAFDPSVSSGAASRAFRRLLKLGYLLPARAPGRKSHYTPAWGLIEGAARPVNLAARGLGRPPHLYDLRLPQRLLDTYLGRLEPHHSYTAVVTRYVTQPLLTLADVGAYAVAMAGLPARDGSLPRLGLLRDGLPEPPPTDAELLAQIAGGQLQGLSGPVALTSAGVARAALLAAPVAPPPAHARRRTSGGQIGTSIGEVIGGVIGSACESEEPPGAQQSPQTRSPESVEGSHGVGSKEGAESPSAPPPPRECGGGEMTTGDGHAASSPAALALEKIGVRRDIAASLAARPPAQVERVIAEARARTGVRCLPAWVVSALRALPVAEPAARPPKVSDLAILTHSDLSNSERLRWLTRFRNAEPADRPAILARFHDEHPAGG